jgi:tripartite-type tricarboxylate transporter receptor subunit TctC
MFTHFLTEFRVMQSEGLVRRVIVACALGAMGLPVLAQADFPSKPIRFVVPYPPGGPTDLMARLLQPELQSRLGVTVIIDNKAGAGGNVGSAEVAKQAPADGHTLLLV